MLAWAFLNERPSCLRLFWHSAERALARELCTAGSRRASRITITTITTSSSTSVKPPKRRLRLQGCMFVISQRLRLCRGSAGRLVARIATACLLRRFVCCGVFCSAAPPASPAIPSGGNTTGYHLGSAWSTKTHIPGQLWQGGCGVHCPRDVILNRCAFPRKNPC